MKFHVEELEHHVMTEAYEIMKGLTEEREGIKNKYNGHKIVSHKQDSYNYLLMSKSLEMLMLSGALKTWKIENQKFVEEISEKIEKEIFDLSYLTSLTFDLGLYEQHNDLTGAFANLMLIKSRISKGIKMIPLKGKKVN